MPAASEPLTPATTVLKLSKVPSAISRAAPPFGAAALTYSKCLKPAEYFKSPNDDTPCRQFLSSANAVPIELGHVSGSAATPSRVEPSSDLRFIRPSRLSHRPSFAGRKDSLNRFGLVAIGITRHCRRAA